jgi:hypothetical protein
MHRTLKEGTKGTKDKEYLKVRKFQKKILASSILHKNQQEQFPNFCPSTEKVVELKIKSLYYVK